MSGSRKNRRRLLATLIVGLLTATSCWAGSGGTIKLPAATGKKVKNGIIADIDTRWTSGWGYRPVTITLSVRKSKRDRSIQVNLLPESQYYGGFSSYDPLSVTTVVEIPQGEKKAAKTIFVPQQSPWSVMRAEFFEEGRKLKDLSMDWPVSWPTARNTGHDNNSPCVLLVDKDAPGIDEDRDALIRKLKKEDSENLPDAEKFEFLGSNAYMRRQINTEYFKEKGRATDDESLTTLKEMNNIEMLPPSDLPENPIGLSGIDVIIMPVAELSELAESDSEKFRAIDYYVRNGGNLVVYGADEIWQRTADVFQRDLDWIPANESLFPEDIDESYDEMAISGTDDGDYLEKAIQRRARTKSSRVPADVPKFESAFHGLGTIVAVSSNDPYGEAVAYWQWILHQIGVERLTWVDRHGISLIGNNNDYWDYMIPGYGASPVEGFLGVITLFILLIGPLNFYLLKRFKRLYLLPLTVVLAALLTTVTMMCYAVVSDGVATHVRLRSFTLLDQEGDEHIAMTRCRHSYLAAITPSDGLSFPAHTCVYPVQPFSTGSEERVEVLRDRAGVRRLSKGYMRSRTTTQFLTTDVQSTPLGIENGPNGITNNLGVDLTLIWICDEEGKFAQANDVPADAVLQLKTVESKEAMKTINKVASANQPVPPPGLDSSNANNFIGMGGGRNRWRYSRSRPAYSTTSILHENTKYLPSFFKEAKPNSYLAIASQAPPFLHMGTKATQVAGFHVIKGGL